MGKAGSVQDQHKGERQRHGVDDGERAHDLSGERRSIHSRRHLTMPSPPTPGLPRRPEVRARSSSWAIRPVAA